MAVSRLLRRTDKANPVPEFTGVGRKRRGATQPNMGTEDVRGLLATTVITLTNFGGTDSFKIKVVYGNRDRTDITDQEEGRPGATQTTAAFVRGTNAAASDLQTALRTATGDTGLTVAGSTDAGPFTITPGPSPHSQAYEFQLITLLGCSGQVESSAVAYRTSNGLPGDVHKHGTDTGRVTASATIGRSVGSNVPLGQSIVTDGPGQTRGTVLAAPTVVAPVAGNTSVDLTATEHASGGTAADVGYAVFLTSNDKLVSFTTDADGTVTISGLARTTDYYVRAFTITASGTADQPTGRVSKSAPPQFFTTT